MAKAPAEIALGPMLIGTVFNIVLYGIMITQVYLYFNTYKNDRKWLKCLVLFLFLADTVNAVFDLVYIYDALIINFNNVAYLAQATWVFGTDPAMTGIISCSVQLFFAWRVKVVTGNIWAVILIAACAIINMLSSVGTSVAVGMIPVFTEFVRFKVIVIMWLVSAAVADVCITVSLTHHLQKHKTGFAATDDVVNRIIRLTVQTGAITAICAIIDLIFFLVDTTGTHLIFNVPLSKLYTNSLMSSLNARGGWKFSQRSGQATSTQGAITAAKSRMDVVQLNTTGTRPEVFVQVESHEMVDVEDNKDPNHLFPDEQEYNQKIWEGGDVKTESVGSVV